MFLPRPHPPQMTARRSGLSDNGDSFSYLSRDVVLQFCLYNNFRSAFLPFLSHTFFLMLGFFFLLFFACSFIRRSFFLPFFPSFACISVVYLLWFAGTGWFRLNAQNCVPGNSSRRFFELDHEILHTYSGRHYLKLEEGFFFNFFFQAEDGIRDRSPSRGLGDVYKRQSLRCV